MNEFPAVRVLLAAACLGAAGLAMPAHAALLNCEGLKLAAQTFTKDVKQLSCCAG